MKLMRKPSKTTPLAAGSLQWHLQVEFICVFQKVLRKAST